MNAVLVSPPPFPSRLPQRRRWLPLLAAVLLAPAALGQPNPSREPGLGAPADVPRLLEVLRQPDASVADKARACQQLAIAGHRDAVPPLAALLPDTTLGTYARAALEAIPDASATDALRQALATLQGNPRIGVIHSLAARKDARAVQPLAALIHPPAPDADHALLALARIGTPEAQQILRDTLANGPAPLRAPAAEGCLLLAETELQAGRNGRAMALYDSVRETPVSRPLFLAATRGAILVRGSAGVGLLLRQWRAAEPDLVTLAARVSRELPGAEVSRALADALADAPAPIQVLLLQALADRADASVRDAIEVLAASPEATVRIASVSALGKLGGPSSVPVLLKSLGPSASPAEVEAAMASLAQLRADAIDPAIVAALEAAPPAARARMITVLGYRKATSATRELLRHAADAPEADVRRAALETLALVAQGPDLPEVVRVALACRDDALREKAEHAMYAVSLKESDVARRGRVLASAFASARMPAERTSLLEVAALLADAPAYDLVAAAYRDSADSVRDTALRLLAHWPEARPAPLLLQVFKTTANPVHRTLALRGIVTLGTLWTEAPARSANRREPPPREALAWLAEANAALRDNAEEKRTLLSGLASFGCAEGLRLIEGHFNDPAVRKDAELAFIRAAKGVTTPEDLRAARPVVERLAAQASDAEVRQQAGEALKALRAAEAKS